MADKKNISAAAADNAGGTKSGLGVLALASIVISSMIGGGIYSLPQNLSCSAGLGYYWLRRFFHRQHVSYSFDH